MPTLKTPPSAHVRSSPTVLDEITNGQGITFSQAAKLLPGSRGRSCSPATVHRWATVGILAQGGTRVMLEVALLGCRMITSKAALVRFLKAQQPDAGPAEQASEKIQGRREREIAAAEKALKKAGV